MRQTRTDGGRRGWKTLGARGLQGYIVANVEPLIVNMILNSDVNGKVLEIKYSKDTRNFNTIVE